MERYWSSHPHSKRAKNYALQTVSIVSAAWENYIPVFIVGEGILVNGSYIDCEFCFPSAQLAGIVQPNDGSCNLAKIPNNEFGEYEYTRSLNQVDKLI